MSEDRADEEHQGLLSYTGQPGFDPLRSDARFTARLRKTRDPDAVIGEVRARKVQ